MRTQKSRPTGTSEGKDSKSSIANKNDDDDGSKRSFATDSSEGLFDNSEDDNGSSEKQDDTNLQVEKFFDEKISEGQVYTILLRHKRPINYVSEIPKYEDYKYCAKLLK